MKISLELVRDIEAIKDRDAKVLAAAVMYADQGMYIVPIRTNGKALPGKSYNFNYSHASRNKKVVKKWFGHGGKFEGWNIGLAAGRKGGIFVIDLDMHGEIDGMSNFDKLVPKDYKFLGPVQSTPSGGKHLVCLWREYATSSTAKIAEGVDTRGGDAESCKGHIVAWPSIVNGNPYKWDAGGEILGTPDWIMTHMGRPWQKTGHGNRGNENINSEDVEDKFTLDSIVGMFTAIEPDELSYSEWLECGQATHSQHPNPEGLAVWEQWSQQGERYQNNECASRWAGFNESGPIRIGTLIHYAQQRGYELMQIVEDPNKDELDELVAELNKRFAVVPMGSDVLIVEEIEVAKEVARIQPKYRIFKKAGFKSLLENQFTIMADSKGTPCKKTHAEIWLAHENRRTYSSGIGMFPNQEKRYQGYFNIWGGFSVEPEPGDWGLYKDHIRTIISNGDDEIYEWVMDWLADLVQDPANPKGCAIVMSGIEGCGKGTFAQFIGDLFGTGFKHITDEEHLVGRFNGHMMDCVVAFADEVTYGGNRKVAGKLKALVSEKFITAERKGIDAIQYHNCAHLLVASNENWFIPAGPQSRRWLVLDVSGEQANASEYFNNIHRQMEQEGGLAAMLAELQGRHVTRNLKKAPETQALRDQRSHYAEMNSITAWWSGQLSKGILDMPPLRAKVGDTNDWPEMISSNDAFDAYQGYCRSNNRRTVANNAFFKQVRAFGWAKKRLRENGERMYAYSIPHFGICLQIAKRDLGIDLTQEGLYDED